LSRPSMPLWRQQRRHQERFSHPSTAHPCHSLRFPVRARGRAECRKFWVSAPKATQPARLRPADFCSRMATVKEAGDLSKSISTEKRAVAGAILFLAILGAAPLVAAAQDGPRFPTTVFAEGETSATVTVGDVTATVSQTLRPDIDPNLAVPILEVTVKGEKVLEVPGVASGMDFVASEASIAEIDPDNDLPEV